MYADLTYTFHLASSLLSIRILVFWRKAADSYLLIQISKMSIHHQTSHSPQLFKLPSYEINIPSPSYQKSADLESVQLPHRHIAAQVTQITPPIIVSPNGTSRVQLFKYYILVIVDLAIFFGLATLYFIGCLMSSTDKTGYCATHIELTRVIDAVTPTTAVGLLCCGLGIARRLAFQRNPSMTGIDVGLDILMSLIGIGICLGFSSVQRNSFFGCKSVSILRLVLY